MKRRSFLQKSSLITLPLLVNGFPISAVGKEHSYASLNNDSDNILVLIQLNGGNDGLNTIIPLDKYNILGNVRSNLLIPESQVIKLDDATAFHPSLSAVKGLYDDAKMLVVQDVGYPNQNRSHFRSTDIWTSGSPADQTWTTGWLGRYLENRYPYYPIGYPNEDFPDPFAIKIGNSISETCQGNSANFSLALTDPFALNTLSEGTGDFIENLCYATEVDYVKTAIAQSNAYSIVISEAAEKGNNSVAYPDDNALAQQLKTIALLISGGLKTRIYIASLGGFDTHANQAVEGDATSGEHAQLLENLSRAVAAFQSDLSLLGFEEKVLTMTFSEFGRRIRSNESVGTDHGTAAPLMLFGSCVNPGILGNSPELPENPSVQDGVPMQFDFRNVYGSVLMDWFGVEENEVKSLLFDGFNYLPVVQNCNNTSSDNSINLLEEIDLKIYPNPCHDWTEIELIAEGKHLKISLYDAMGQELSIIANQHLNKGVHRFRLDMNPYAAGNYFINVSGERKAKTIAFIKS